VFICKFKFKFYPISIKIVRIFVKISKTHTYMEFPFYISSVIPTDENGYSVITSKTCLDYQRNNKVYFQP